MNKRTLIIIMTSDSFMNYNYKINQESNAIKGLRQLRLERIKINVVKINVDLCLWYRILYRDTLRKACAYALGLHPNTRHKHSTATGN